MGFFKKSDGKLNWNPVAIVALLGFLALVVVPTLAAPTYTADDFFTKLVECKTDITSGYCIFEVQNPTLSASIISKADFSSKIQNAIGSKAVNVVYYVQQQRDVVSKVNTCSLEKNGTWVNGSSRFDNVCSSGNITRQENYWADISSVSFASGEILTIKAVLTYPPVLGKTSFDWIPKFTYGGTTYEQSKWSWFNTSWSNRVNVTVNTARIWDLVQFNESFFNITRSNIGGSDIRVIECGSGAQVQYQPLTWNSTDGTFWWNNTNTSAWVAKGKDNWTMFRITNTSETCYSVYFNNPAATDNSDRILIREDDFESYAVSTSGNAFGWSVEGFGGIGGTASAVQIKTLSDGSKGLGLDDSAVGYNTLGFSSPVNFSDHTLIFEMNNTNDYSLTGMITKAKKGGQGDGYDSQFRDSPDTFEWNLDRYSGGTRTVLGAGGAGTGLRANNHNWTLLFNGSTMRNFVNFNTTAYGKVDDSTYPYNDSIGWGAAGPFGRTKAMRSFRLYNLPIMQYSPANLTVGPVEFEPSVTSLPSVTINFPSNATYVMRNMTFNWSVTTGNLSTVLRCWKNLDGVQTNVGSTINGTTNTSFSGNLAEGSHTLNITCQETLGSPRNGSAVVGFSIFNDVPRITITLPQNTTYFVNNLTFNFTAVDNITQVLRCWRILDGTELLLGPVSNNTPYLNFSGQLSSGSHLLNITCQDDGPTSKNGSSIVGFSVNRGINVIARLPNGTYIPNWQFTVTNGTNTTTFTGLSNPTILQWSQLNMTGTLFFNATASGYDNESWTVAFDNSADEQHNFTLYTSSYFYLKDGAGNFLSYWSLDFVNSSTMVYRSFSSGGAFLITAGNRGLFNGTNILNASKTGYSKISQSQLMDVSVSYNVTFTTNSSLFIIQVLDEILPSKRPGFNVDMNLISTNVTTITMTGARYGKSCLYDFDDTTVCDTGSVNPPDSSTGYANVSSIQAFDYSNSTFVLNATFSGSTNTVGLQLNVLIDNDIAYTFAGSLTGVNNVSSLINFSNTNQTHARAANITLQLRISCSAAGSCSTTLNVNEFRQLNNTIGYVYIDNTTNTIGYPVQNILGFTTYDVWIKGEETYETLYNQNPANKRMYRISLSSFSDTTLTGYLLKDSLGYPQNFQVLTPNNLPITGALLSIGKFFGGIETTIAQCSSNAAGSCQIWMAISPTLYTFHAMAIGFSSINAVPPDSASYFTGTPQPANVYMTPSGASVNITSIYNGISVSLLPTTVYNQMAPVNASCTVNAVLGNIISFNWTGYLFNTTTGNFSQISFQSSTASTGGTLLFSVNQTGRFRYICGYQWFSNATTVLSTYQDAASVDFYINSDQSQNSALGFLDARTRALFSLFILMIAGILVYIRFRHPVGTLLILGLIAVALAWVGFLSWYVVAAMIIASLAGVVVFR